MTREQLFIQWLKDFPESNLARLTGMGDFPGDHGCDEFVLLGRNLNNVRSVWSSYYADHKDLISDGVIGNIHDSES